MRRGAGADDVAVAHMVPEGRAGRVRAVLAPLHAFDARPVQAIGRRPQMVAFSDRNALDALVRIFGPLVEITIPLMEVFRLRQHLVGVPAVRKRNAVGQVGLLPVDSVVALGHQRVAVGLFLGNSGLAVVEDSPDAGLVLKRRGIAGTKPESRLFERCFRDKLRLPDSPPQVVPSTQIVVVPKQQGEIAGIQHCGDSVRGALGTRLFPRYSASRE